MFKFKTFQQPKRIIRFRRFCHKAYAAFCSLHREVTIGRIAAYMTDLEMLKQGKSVAVTALLLFAGVLPLPADEGVPDDSTLLTSQQLSLQEVLVVSHKAELNSETYRLVTQVTHDRIETLPIQTIADILQYLPGLDVRTRGANGAQADIAMRGGTFDQVLLLINGVSLNDFQTGHYTLNIPISSEIIERVEVLQGTSAKLYGAFSGAINIITRRNIENQRPHQATFGLAAGMNGLVHPEVAASIQQNEALINLSADYSRSDGYYAPVATDKESLACRNSDVQLANLYLQTRWRGLDVQVGAQWKDAGLGMGYGFGSQDQFDATRTAFALASYEHRWNAWRLEAQAAYRANYDRYEWHRGQRLYGNFHFAQTTSAALSVHYASRIGTTSFGVRATNENMHSTNLGDTIHPNGQVPNVHGFDLADMRVLELVRGGNRGHINYFAEQTFYYAGLSASIGINGAYHSQFRNHWAGGANIGYTFRRGGTLYANAHRALRMPTFTDLYYNAGNQLGNRNLRPEEAWILSLGYKGDFAFESKSSTRLSTAGTLSVAADAYYRWGKNIIDWVYVPEDTKRPFHATNQQKVNAVGVELSVAYRLNEWLRNLSVDYAYTYLDLNLKESGSRYLDYLSHKLIVRLEHGIYKRFGASWSLRYQKREGQFNDAQGLVQDYRPVWLLDGSLFWQNSSLRISVECTNMTNTRYYDYGGILQPGAWARIHIKATL